MARKTKRPAARRATAKKKKVVKTPKKTAALQRKAPKKEIVKRTIPNPVAGAFLVTTDCINASSGTVSYLATNGEEFTVDVTKARLFPTEAEARAMIDGALVLADSVSPFHGVQIVRASVALRPHYCFSLIDGMYLLSVDVRPLGDDTALSFAAAKRALTKALTDTLRDVEGTVKRFKKMWG